MLSYKAVSMGLSTAITRAMGLDVATGVVAAGAAQASATHLDNAVTFVGTVASGTGVRLSVNAIGGDSQLVYNGGANPLNVYPPVGAAINGLPTNAAMILLTNTSCEFFFGSTTQVAAVLSA